MSILDTSPQNLQVSQITSGPSHHLFGYIGQSLTTPWSGDERWMLALRSTFHDHLPDLAETAEILLLDTHDDDRPQVVARTHAWNFQQGTMLYWNPEAPSSQFVFNDLDPRVGRPFTVLYDHERGERLHEFRWDDAWPANSGMSPTGGRFVAINQARIAHSHKQVIGYMNCESWSMGKNAPEDDGLFVVDLTSGERELLVSYAQIQALDLRRPDGSPRLRGHLAIHHTLWNRAGDRIAFAARCNHGTTGGGAWLLYDFATRSLRPLCGGDGHPEWDDQGRLISVGPVGDGKGWVAWDQDTGQPERVLANLDEIGDLGADRSLSPDGRWLVSGHADAEHRWLHYAIKDLHHDRSYRLPPMPAGTTNHINRRACRIDPNPCWNRSSTQVLLNGVDDQGVRQLFVSSVEDLP